jgi:glycosyltransferase involved in cell wall biosynthesis
VFSGGLTTAERLACLGLREVLRPHNSMAAEREAFRRWSPVEREIIAGHRYIVTPSPWAEAWARRINGRATYSHADLPLRAAFYAADPWDASACRGKDIFCSAAYLAPFKGVHDAIKAFAVLRQDVPTARLRIAGEIPRVRGPRREGYAAWLRRLCAKLSVADAVDWLGALPAEDLVRELLRCAAMVMPSHCESYCMALAEAQYLGVPAVTTRVGGTEWLAGDGRSALFYAPGNVSACAGQLRRVLTEQELPVELGAAARALAIGRHDLATIVCAQLRLYETVRTGE